MSLNFGDFNTKQGGGVVILENETGDGPLIFILILKSCGVGEW